MKKHLLSVLAAALIVPAVSINAGSGLTQLWKYETKDLNATWTTAAPDWSSETAIKATSCSRFGHGKDGKIYTVNMKTMSIAEITENGWKDVYKLPSLAGITLPNEAGVETPDVYGTAISMDEAGNFLIGHFFTAAPLSSTVWTIYNPTTGKAERFDLGVPADYTDGVDGHSGIGRIDCVGRVLGDLTKDAVFFIAPSFSKAPNKYSQLVRIVNISHEGDKLNVDASTSKYLYNAITSAYTQTIAQPVDATFDDFAEREYEYTGFQMFANYGGLNDFCQNTSTGDFFDWAFYQTPLKKFVNTDNCGFDTFVLNGVRYYVFNYLQTPNPANTRTMDIAIFDESGAIIETWQNPDYVCNNGYSSIVAEPLENGTANIYVYNSRDPKKAEGQIVEGEEGRVAAAMLNFDPSKVGALLGSEDNPYIISTPADLTALGSNIMGADYYVEFDADIDMKDASFTTINATAFVHVNGNNHVIKNLTITDFGGNAAMFANFTGEIKNLGLENCSANVSGAWGTSGTFVGYAFDATLENCYATGKISNFYAGGLIAGVQASKKAVIRNCYSAVEVASETGYAGGLVGALNDNTVVTIENAYASGKVTGKAIAAGIVAGVNDAFSGGTLNLKNVAAWNGAITCQNKNAPVVFEQNNLTVNTNNVLVWDGVLLNGDAVSEGKSNEELQGEITGWDGFNEKLNNGYPVLAWQNANGETSGIVGVAADVNEGKAEYFNLQGIRVNNPENGIYIVRRAGKVTKEYIR